MPLYDIGIASEKIPVVIEFGTYHTKVGFAGEPCPRHLIRSFNVKASNKVTNICDTKLSEDELLEELTTFLHAIYFRYLLVNPKDRRVVVCEDFVQTERFRNCLSRVLFKQFSVVGLLLTPALPLALVPLGTPTGLIVNIGYKDSSSICVYEGMVIIKSYKSIEVGTHAHLLAIEKMIKDSGEVTVKGERKKFTDAYGELEISQLEDIRARTCFCGERPKELEDKSFSSSGTTTPSRAVDMNYPLSDGHNLIVTGAVRERSVEVLYDGDGDDNSLGTIVLDSLQQCPIDCRTALASKIVVIGGGCMLPGFTYRLKQEILAMLEFPRYDNLVIKKLKFYKPNYYASIMSWVGGSIMGSVEHLHEKYITRDFYNHKGECTLPNWSSLHPPVRDLNPSTPIRRTSSPLLSKV